MINPGAADFCIRSEHSNYFLCWKPRALLLLTVRPKYRALPAGQTAVPTNHAGPFSSLYVHSPQEKLI
jgi:hypothetical protein